MAQEAVQEMAAHLRALQAQANAIAQQVGMVQATLAEHERAVATLEELQKMAKERDLLVPVGAGTYLFATMARTDKVLADLGAGVSAERSPADTLAALQKRKEELAAVHQRLVEGLARLEDEEERVQAELASIVQQAQEQG
jgi:prefoldin alpha subunit